MAQTVLPGIVVEGATLERAPVTRPKPALQREPAAPAQKTTPAKQKAAVAAQAQVNAASTAGAAETVPQGTGGAQDTAGGIPLRQLGSAVTVISGKDLEQQQVRTVADALRGQSGAGVLVSGTPGSVTSVSIRGEKGKYTRVIIDGVDASTTKDGELDFSMLSAEQIERIEIVRGPMSALYGSGAIGGVINVITKAPRGPLAGSMRVEGGSFGTKDIAGNIGGGSESGYLSVAGQLRDIKGFNIAPTGFESDGTRLATVNMRGGVTLSPDAKLDFTLRHVEKRSAYDAFGADFVTPQASKPFHTADDSDNVLRQRQTLAGVKLSWDSLGGALTQDLKAAYNRDLSVTREAPLPGTAWYSPFTKVVNTRDESTRLTYGYGLTYRFGDMTGAGKHAVSGQIERETETFTPFSDYDTFFGDYNGDGIERRRNRLSFAGEWRGVYWDRLALSAGVRHDNNDTFRDFTTWRTSASYDFKETGTRPHASLGTGVKMPGMYEQYGANQINYESNPNLKPEMSRGFDVGVEQRFLGGRATVDVTYFNNRLQDAITPFGFNPLTFRTRAENLTGISRRQGVEVATRFIVTRALSLGLAYTYTDARDPEGLREFRRTPHSGRADVRYLFDEGKGTFSFGISANGRTPEVVYENPSYTRHRIELDGYWLAQVAASYKIAPNVEIYGRIENAFNQKYQEIYGYSAPRLGAYAGVKIDFDTAPKPPQR